MTKREWIQIRVSAGEKAQMVLEATRCHRDLSSWLREIGLSCSKAAVASPVQPDVFGKCPPLYPPPGPGVTIVVEEIGPTERKGRRPQAIPVITDPPVIKTPADAAKAVEKLGTVARLEHGTSWGSNKALPGSLQKGGKK